MPWGWYDELFSPAFWKERAIVHADEAAFQATRFGDTLQEETAFCLLGGYGVPAEIGVEVFNRLRRRGLIDGAVTESDLYYELLQPIIVGGRARHYRFARQKARYLASTLRALDVATVPTGARELREFLTRLPGIGPKTASWITRNYLLSDAVAVIDIHILRICKYIGVFPAGAEPNRDYLDLERRFLTFAKLIDVPPSFLDNLMWYYARRLWKHVDVSDRRHANSNPASLQCALKPNATDAHVTKSHAKSSRR